MTTPGAEPREEEFIAIPDAATKMGTDQATLRSWIKALEIRCHKVGSGKSGRTVIRRSTLDALVESNLVTPRIKS